MTSLSRRFSQASLGLLLVMGLGAGVAQAGTLVRMDTTFGSLTLELYDQETPISVSNFLHYLGSGAYARGVVHRLDTDAKVIQGGMVRYKGDCSEGVLINCSTDWVEAVDPIPNEAGIANTRGTLAYARTADINSATSQWFINTEDNPGFNTTVDEDGNEAVGYAVFGRVLGDGMQVVDRMTGLRTVAVGEAVQQLPLRGDMTIYPQEADLVMYNMYQVARYSEALNLFEFQSGRLSLTVDVPETGPLSLQMVMIGTDPQPIFEVDTDTLVTLAEAPEGIASFNTSANPAIVQVPVIEINEHGSIYEMRNVVFRLIDEASLRFQLISFQ